MAAIASSMLTDAGRWPLNQADPKRVGAAAELLAYAVRVGERIEEYEESLKQDCQMQMEDYLTRIKTDGDPDTFYEYLVKVMTAEDATDPEREQVEDHNGKYHKILDTFYSMSTTFKLAKAIYSLRELCLRIIRSQTNSLPFTAFKGENKPLVIYKNQPVNGSEWNMLYQTAADYLMVYGLNKDVAHDVLQFFFKRHHLLAVHVDQLERAVRRVSNSERPWLRYEGLDDGEYFVVNSPIEFIGDLVDKITLPLQLKRIEIREGNIADVERYAIQLFECVGEIGEVHKTLAARGRVKALEETPSQSSVDSSRSTEDEHLKQQYASMFADVMRNSRGRGFMESYSIESLGGMSNSIMSQVAEDMRYDDYNDIPEEKEVIEEKEAVPLDDDNDDGSATIILVAFDSDDKIQFKREMAKRSKMIKTMLEADQSTERIKFTKAVTVGALQIVHEYLTDVEDDWTERLQNMKPVEQLAALIECLHYLDIEGGEFLKMACWEIAVRISGGMDWERFENLFAPKNQ